MHNYFTDKFKSIKVSGHLCKNVDIKKSNHKFKACQNCYYNSCKFVSKVYFEDDIQFESENKGEAIRTIFGCSCSSDYSHGDLMRSVFGLAPS